MFASENNIMTGLDTICPSTYAKRATKVFYLKRVKQPNMLIDTAKCIPFFHVCFVHLTFTTSGMVIAQCVYQSNADFTDFKTLSI